MSKKNYDNLMRLLRGKDHVRIENEGYMPLVVEKLWFDQVSLCHYGEQNGDPMRDPEVVFLVEGEKAKPVYFRNDYIGVEHATVEDHFGDVPVKPRLQKDLESFCRMWWNNIREQGFFEKAKELSAMEQTEEPQSTPTGSEPAAKQGKKKMTEAEWERTPTEYKDMDWDGPSALALDPRTGATVIERVAIVPGQGQEQTSESVPEKPRVKLSEAAKQAVETEDVVLLGKVVDQLRFKHGYDYDQCLEYVQKHTGIDAAKYEGMLYEADTRGAEIAEATRIEQRSPDEPKSWKVGVKTVEDTNWVYNAVRFPTKAEAESYGSELSGRWAAVTEFEAHPADDEPKVLSPLKRQEALQVSAQHPKSLAEGPENLKPPETQLASGIHKEDVTMSETIKSVTEKNGDERKPEAKLTCGDVRGSVWLNRNEKGGEYLSVSIARVYRAQDGTTKATQSYRQKDLPDLIELAQGAQKIIQEESQQRGLESQTDVQKVKITR